MKRIGIGCIFLSLSCLLLLSCKSPEEIVSGRNQERDRVCLNLDSELSCGNRNHGYPVEIEKLPLAVFNIAIKQAIKNADTLEINELICVDSILFTQAFNDIHVSDICREMHVEGNTYFLAKTNKYGGFEEVNVVRSVDPCFKWTEEEIMRKVLSMRIIPENAGTYEILFRYQFLLD